MPSSSAATCAWAFSKTQDDVVVVGGDDGFQSFGVSTVLRRIRVFGLLVEGFMIPDVTFKPRNPKHTMCKVQGFSVRWQDLGFGALGFGFRILRQELGFRVGGFGCRV